jgi:EmrB/QacA subfamily drug resistance transporter
MAANINDMKPNMILDRKTIFWSMAGIMLTMLLGALDQTCVGTSMPRIIADLGGFNQYTWATSIYMIASAVVVPIAGKLSDIYGRKILYLIGIAIFVVFSLLCGLSRNMTELIVFRGLQGIGGGCLMTLAFVAIADLFPPEKRGTFQGFLTIVFSFASIVGPTMGGYLTDHLSWHWVFFINVPLGIVVFGVFVKFFPNMRFSKGKQVIDYGGLVTLILFVIPTMLALSFGGVKYPWVSGQIIGLFGFAAAMFGLFLFLETRSPEPILPLSLFKNRIVAISNLTSFLMGMGMFGSGTFVPLFLQGVLGASATLSGNLQIPQSFAVMLTAFLSGRSLTKARGQYRNLGMISMVLICAGAFWMSRMSVNSTYWVVMTANCVIGFGLGFSIPVFTIAIQNSVKPEILGVATSSNTFLRSLGGSVGLAFLGSIMNSRFSPEFIKGIPADIKSKISIDSLNALANNPQALVNAQAQAQLRDTLNNAGVGASGYDQVMQALRGALSSAITTTFLIAFFILLVGLVTTFWMKGKK